MARTRAQIKTLVKQHVGWQDRTDKDSLIESLCDSALKYALMEHAFRDLTTVTSGEAEITVGDTEFDLSAFDPSVYKVISARLIRSSATTDEAYILPFKNRMWWDKFIVDPSIRTQGVPQNGLRVKDKIYFDRPIESGWKLRLRYTSINTYTSDTTPTPSELLDLFVEYKVTADTFFSLEDMEKYMIWNRRAIGNNPEFPGGELARAIRADDRETAKELNLTRPWSLRSNTPGFMTKDLNWETGDEHDQFRSWF